MKFIIRDKWYFIRFRTLIDERVISTLAKFKYIDSHAINFYFQLPGNMADINPYPVTHWCLYSIKEPTEEQMEQLVAEEL